MKSLCERGLLLSSFLQPVHGLSATKIIAAIQGQRIIPQLASSSSEIPMLSSSMKEADHLHYQEDIPSPL